MEPRGLTSAITLAAISYASNRGPQPQKNSPVALRVVVIYELECSLSG